MTQRAEINLLMVCLGNICRSPTAHAVMQHKLNAAGLAATVAVDSAGTAAYHIGKAPDPRSIEAAARRGYDLRELRARQVSSSDFRHFDYLLAMDHSNHGNLLRLSGPDGQSQVHLLLDFAADAGLREVPDPYYGGEQGFEQVLDLVEQACDGLLAHLQADLQQRR